MKKILSVILIITISINLVGCEKTKVKTSNAIEAQEMEYKFKPTYSRRVSTLLGLLFIDVFRATENVGFMIKRGICILK